MTLSPDKVFLAAKALKGTVRQTELIKALRIGGKNDVYLKTENLQVTGSFKVRGAYFKLSQLTPEQKKQGVVACSAGNHAQGVALAAQKMGIASKIYIPTIAPLYKIEATKAYGAEVVLVDGLYDDAYQQSLKDSEGSGHTFIHPFNDEDVIAGQATIGLEILDQLDDVDAVVVPIGGGGLISGIAFIIKTLKPSCKVYGVQAAGAESMVRSIHSGNIETLNKVQTFADGIAVKVPGDLTFELCQRYVDDVFSVTDDEIATAVLTLMEQQKLVAEGAGATALAALLFDKIPLENKKIACVISGGNIDVSILSRVIHRGLLTSGRYTSFSIELADQPGQLKQISRIVADLGANVVQVFHNYGSIESNINGCYLQIAMETRNHAHIEQVYAALRECGYQIMQRN
ncbi:MAG: threonine ammonia-lyase [Brevinema sp.]